MYILHTVALEAFKENVDTVNAVYSTKIHLPPHGLVWRVCSYISCLRTRFYVSIYCVASVECRGYIGM